MPHVETQACLAKADSLIENGDIDSFRYASLQLRMGIEYLFYELIPLYREELPEDILTKWQPKDVLDAILACDPDADKDARYAIGPSGQTGPTFNADLLMDSKAPNKRMLKQHYHRLGSYLHAPVSMVNPPLDKWQADLEDAATCLREYGRGQILSNVRVSIEYECICGKPIKRNKAGVEATGIMQCHDPKCRAIFDVKFEGGKETFSLRQESYNCPYCNSTNYVSAGAIKDGLPITCVECGKRVVVRPWFQLVPLDGDPNAIDDDMTDSQIAEFFAKTGNAILERINATKKVSVVVKASEVLMGRLVQSGNTLRVLTDNATHEWIWDGASIVRTSYDAMLQALYIFHDEAQREELATRFLDFRVVEQVKLLRLFEKELTSVSRRLAQSPRRAKYEAEIVKEFDRVCQKYGIDQSKRLPDDWHGSNLRVLAEKAGYESEYEILQKQLSAIVHSSVFGIETTYLKPGHLIQFQWDFAFRVLDKVAAYAGVELSDTERRLLDLSRNNIFDRTESEMEKQKNQPQT